MGTYSAFGTRTSSSGSTHGGHGGSIGASSNGVSNGTPSSAKSAASYSPGWTDLLRSISDANNAFNLDQVKYVNDFNAAEAQKNRDWQYSILSRAHQIETEDLIKAGLNPILSAGGQGAVTGSGAVASGQKAVADNIYGNGIMSLMSSMISAASAQSVAGIYAKASMYGADVQAATQKNYQSTWRDIAGQQSIDKQLQSGLSFISSLVSSALAVKRRK